MQTTDEIEALESLKKDILTYIDELKCIVNNGDITLSDKVSNVIKLANRIDVKARMINVIKGGMK